MHILSIPSPTPSFFPTITMLKTYRLMEGSITPFLSISLICPFIHSFSLADLGDCFCFIGFSSFNLISCFTNLQFPISLWTQTVTLTGGAVDNASQKTRDQARE